MKIIAKFVKNAIILVKIVYQVLTQINAMIATLILLENMFLIKVKLVAIAQMVTMMQEYNNAKIAIIPVQLA